MCLDILKKLGEENTKRIFNVVVGSGILILPFIIILKISRNISYFGGDSFLAWIVAGLIYLLYVFYSLSFLEKIKQKGYGSIFSFAQKNFGDLGKLIINIPLFFSSIFALMGLSLVITILVLNLIYSRYASFFFFLTYESFLYSIIFSVLILIILAELYLLIVKKEGKINKYSFYAKLFLSGIILILALLSLTSKPLSLVINFNISTILYLVTVILWAYKGFEYIFVYSKNEEEELSSLKVALPLILGFIIILYSIIYLGVLSYFLSYKPFPLRIFNFIKDYLLSILRSELLVDLLLVLFIFFVVITFFGSFKAVYNFLTSNLLQFSTEEKRKDRVFLLIVVLAAFLLISISLSSSKDLLDIFLKVSQAATTSVVLFYIGLSYLDISYLKNTGKLSIENIIYPLLVTILSLVILFFVSPEVLSTIIGVYLLSIVLILLTSK